MSAADECGVTPRQMEILENIRDGRYFSKKKFVLSDGSIEYRTTITGIAIILAYERLRGKGLIDCAGKLTSAADAMLAAYEAERKQAGTKEEKK